MFATVMHVGICILVGGIVLAFCLYAHSGVDLGRGAFAIALVASIPGIVALRALAFNYPNENVLSGGG